MCMCTYMRAFGSKQIFIIDLPLRVSLALWLSEYYIEMFHKCHQLSAFRPTAPIYLRLWIWLSVVIMTKYLLALLTDNSIEWITKSRSPLKLQIEFFWFVGNPLYLRIVFLLIFYRSFSYFAFDVKAHWDVVIT